MISTCRSRRATSTTAVVVLTVVMRTSQFRMTEERQTRRRSVFQPPLVLAPGPTQTCRGTASRSQDMEKGIRDIVHPWGTGDTHHSVGVYVLWRVKAGMPLRLLVHRRSFQLKHGAGLICQCSCLWSTRGEQGLVLLSSARFVGWSSGEEAKTVLLLHNNSGYTVRCILPSDQFSFPTKHNTDTTRDTNSFIR